MILEHVVFITVKHLLFVWPYFREAIIHDLFIWDYIFAIHDNFFYSPYIRIYSRGLYFHVFMLSRIYAIIKTSQIKSVLQ